MIKWMKDYVWFVKESQNYMSGYNRVIVFVLSLYKGIGFCKMMRKAEKIIVEE